MHRISCLLICAILLIAGTSVSAAEDWRGTTIPGVSAKFEFLRQYNNVLHLGITLANSTTKAITGEMFPYSEIVIVDNNAKRKYLPQKDAIGHYLAGPVSDWDRGGRWFPELAPQSETLLWADFDAISSTQPVTIQTPFAGQFTATISHTAPHERSIKWPVPAHIDFANRTGGSLSVQVSLSSPSGKPESSPGMVLFENIYALDAQGKRRYPLLKDTSGIYVASPKSDNDRGGRWFIPAIKPGTTTYFNLTFQAPPNSVQAVDIVIPQLTPFENIEIIGKGNNETGGLAVAGSAMSLEGALKDLNAQVSSETIKVNLSADLLFDFDKAVVKPAAESSLKKVATVLKHYPDSEISVDGHADGRGSESYNQALSQKRADTIAKWLMVHANLKPANVHTKGWGKTKPIAPNENTDGSDNPAGRAKNRRVEITVKRTK